MGPTKGAAKPKTSGKGDSKSNKVLGSKVSKKNVKRPPPKEVKSKARTESSQLKKTKKREYSEAELDLPKLNMITPVGVMNPKGKKKGKTFVDDPVCCRLLCDIQCMWYGYGVLTRLVLFRRR